jgi:maltose alpha-D-glucosyltransferase / alpha-amylase
MSSAHPPRLALRGPLREALAREELERLPSDALSSFLLARRWFGGKGHPPRTVRFRDSIPLFEDWSAVTRLEVDPQTSEAATYQLPLAVRPSATGPQGAPSAVLATIASSEGPGILFDALEDPEFRLRLRSTLVTGGRFAGRRSTWVVEPLVRWPYGQEEARLSSAEQSNSSVLFGKRAILKLYRRIAPGENPDVEIGEFLSRHTRFANVPSLLATIRFHDEDGSSTVAAMLQKFVPSSGDGWSHALARAREETAGQAVPTGEGSFCEAAGRLGRITRRLHEALASDHQDPAFAPLPATAADVAAWGEQAATQADRAGQRLAERAAAGKLPEAVRGVARDCLQRLPEVLSHARSLAAALGADAGRKIRHHGDYHLGQVLVGLDGDFVILDFEGEPARPLAERRERQSPLRDVAGMLRSFSYAAAVTARDLGPRPGLETRLRQWEEGARAAFLSGYLGDHLPDFLPQGSEGCHRLLALFEIEKMFYELAYEVDHRPEWVTVPLQAIRRLLDGL